MIPALLDGLVDQPEQLVFGGRGHAQRDPATQPQRSFPALLLFPWVM